MQFNVISKLFQESYDIIAIDIRYTCACMYMPKPLDENVREKV